MRLKITGHPPPPPAARSAPRTTSSCAAFAAPMTTRSGPARLVPTPSSASSASLLASAPGGALSAPRNARTFVGSPASASSLSVPGTTQNKHRNLHPMGLEVEYPPCAICFCDTFASGAMCVRGGGGSRDFTQPLGLVAIGQLPPQKDRLLHRSSTRRYSFVLYEGP